MRLNRRDITGQAFPMAADGYDREAVDRHLDAIAGAVEATAEPVGADAGEQMRTIVEGAEHSAQALRETAQHEADDVRESARLEAEAMRDKAAQESGDQVAAARAAVKGLLERVEALNLGVEDSQRHVLTAAEAMAQRLSVDSEPLVATLRERARALGAELDLIGSGLAAGAVESAQEREQASVPAARSVPPAPPAQSPPPAPAQPSAPAPDRQPAAPPRVLQPSSEDGSPPGTGLSSADLDEARQILEGAAAPAQPAEPETEAAVTPGTERARLVALNMAVSGTPRAEAERHLREELGMDDPRTILDEVYQRAEGR